MKRGKENAYIMKMRKEVVMQQSRREEFNFQIRRILETRDINKFKPLIEDADE
jgi:hypothetical protein